MKAVLTYSKDYKKNATNLWVATWGQTSPPACQNEQVDIFNLPTHFDPVHVVRQIIGPKANQPVFSPLTRSYFTLNLKIIKNIKFFILYIYKDINM